MLGDFKILGDTKMLRNLRFGGLRDPWVLRNLGLSKYWDLLR